MMNRSVTVACAGVVLAAGAVLLAPGAQAQGSLGFDPGIGECVRLGGTVDDATITGAACGSAESNYVVIGKAATSDGCIADRDNFYAETVDDVEVGALCLDVDWVYGGCLDVGGEDPQRIDCGAPAREGIRVLNRVDGTDDVAACASEVGYRYTERHFVVCVEDL
ncbi:LppU family putative lipoprotein [Nocardia asteroides]|uniref:LppU family putative lipoprotein n=1 Tax=Nocardia asteroides TaxID=1824 RepID=UPI001E31FB1A|nr:hypothetical protein [Nocardia asteroides]UGT61990.1 hypothetical protein LTT61_01140 [Nocardia asteroides]